MLDISDAATIDELWERLDSQATLPKQSDEYFAKSGPKPANDQRSYDRHYLRCRAILRHECETHAAYMKDCSRNGMGLLSPIQLFPRDHVQVWLDGNRSYKLEVVRCRRVQAGCYECGTIFVLA